MRLTETSRLAGMPPCSEQAPLWQFVRHAAPLIRNVKTRMALLEFAIQAGTQAFPVSINDGGEQPDAAGAGTMANCYVVSPLTAYTGYADDELSRLGRPWLARPLQGLAGAVGRMLARARIDRIVQVNNWLLSTNPYPPDWPGDELPALTRWLCERFPDHAIGFRSLNHFSNPQLLARLAALGYVSIPSRQVYLFDARQGEQSAFLQRHNVAIDGRLLQRTDYRFIPATALSRPDYARLEQLYNLLYLDKYCRLNPHFSADWLYRGTQDGWLELEALCTPEGRMDGVLGCFGNTGILTAPIVGYDTALPQSLGLYRLLTRRCLQKAITRRCVLNFSAGAAHFKRLRGGLPEIEYSMVYVAHLPAARQRVWRWLGRLLHAIGVPLMQRLKL